MNIPLNIDWQQILLHLLNFAILAGGLYFLLYKPVKDFMDKRTAYYKEMDDQANARLAPLTNWSKNASRNWTASKKKSVPAALKHRLTQTALLNSSWLRPENRPPRSWLTPRQTPTANMTG